MARWDKFIEGLSQGYGTGYQRGRQYLDDQRQRDIDKANTEIGGILTAETPTEAAIPVESTATAPQMSPVATPSPAAALDAGGAVTPQMSPVAPQAAPLAAPTKETPMRLSGNVTGPQTRKQMDQLRAAIANKYQLEGNTAGLMNLDNEMATYRQGKILNNLNEAARLIETNPEAAAQFLHNAYGYYPDGRQAMFTMRDGKLVGYGFDEETNKFSNAMEIDSSSIAALAEQMQDPQAFKRRIAAENLARQTAAYEQAQDLIKNSLEERKVRATEAGVQIDASRAEYQNLLDWATAVDEYFGSDLFATMSGSGKGVKEMKELRGQLNGAIDYFDSAVKDQLLTPAELTIIGGDEGGLGPGYRQVQGAISDILTNNMKYADDARTFSDADVARAALDARMMEMFAQRELAGQDWRGDEAMEEVYADLMKRQQGVRVGPRGTLEMVIDGQTVHLTPQKYPGLARQAGIQANGGPAASTQAVPAQQFESSLVRDEPNFRERLSEAGNEITDAVSRNIVEPVATGLREVNSRRIIGEFQRFGTINREDLESLAGLSPTEMASYGLPDEIIQEVQRFQGYQRAGSGASPNGVGRGQQAIPGV